MKRLPAGTLAAVLAAAMLVPALALAADPASAQATAGQGKKPNILILWGDDIGWNNPSCYHRGMMGYQTPNIVRWIHSRNTT